MKLLLILALLLFLGCSTKAPQNRWQYQSSSAYKNFENYYLKGHSALASMELDRARTYAKQSADLKTLARIELASCGLHVALLQAFTCKEYDRLKPLIVSDELESYEHFLSGKFTLNDIQNLPKQYQNFAKAQLSQNTKAINDALITITPLTSQMIAASLAQEYLSEKSIDTIVNQASYQGYRNGVIVWLSLQIERSSDTKKQAHLSQKLKVLLAP
ncbi:MAG: hypothetical protein U9R50_02260 [Campylobacterota bacterium]|nr:hypothetical protein [Campylobacterota bacterium]